MNDEKNLYEFSFNNDFHSNMCSKQNKIINLPLIWSILKSGPKNRFPTTVVVGGVAVDNPETDIALFGGWSSS